MQVMWFLGGGGNLDGMVCTIQFFFFLARRGLGTASKSCHQVAPLT